MFSLFTPGKLMGELVTPSSSPSISVVLSNRLCNRFVMEQSAKQIQSPGRCYTCCKATNTHTTFVLHFSELFGVTLPPGPWHKGCNLPVRDVVA